MLVKRKTLTDDDIPTLTERVEEAATSSEIRPAWDELVRERSPATIAPVAHSDDYEQARSEFELTVETMVSEILNRHMANAREEITRSILAEVRARLHGGRDRENER